MRGMVLQNPSFVASIGEVFLYSPPRLSNEIELKNNHQNFLAWRKTLIAGHAGEPTSTLTIWHFNNLYFTIQSFATVG